jgi:hypothetical protein
MTERRVFRPEAVDAHARGRESRVADVPLARPWLRWSYWAMIAALVIGGIAGLLVRTDETAAGPAVVQAHGRTFSALVPAGVSTDLATARSFVVELPGSRASQVTVTSLRLRPATPAAVKAAGLEPPMAPSVLLVGTMAGDDAARLGARSATVRGRLVVVLRRESLGQLLARQVRLMVDGSSGG